ncbi:MAG: truncated hemoglobin YjbI [Candidatus Azotimanducaceae bacterium]|jgi:hemoglobin
MAIDQTLHDRLGGRVTFEKVHKIFYDKVYAHPWIRKYFAHRTRGPIESQQSDYMIQLTGGPKCYAGQAPNTVHQYMFITEELFDLRSQLLSDSIKQSGVKDDLRKEWLAVNEMFKPVMVKSSETECVRQYSHQEILSFAK